MTNASIPNSSPGKRSLPIAIAICVVLLIVAVSLLFWQHKKSTSSKSDQGLTHHFSGIDAYRLPGETKGAGMAFAIPSGAVQGRDLTSAKNQMLFGYNLTIKKQVYTILYEAAAISSSATISNDTIKNINDNISASDKSRQAARNKLLTPFQGFIASNINPRFTVALGSGKSFTTTNIHKNVWLVNFTAHDNKPQSNHNSSDLTGQGLIAAGDNHFYYLVIASVDSNWQSNTGFWNQLLNSVKIAQ